MTGTFGSNFCCDADAIANDSNEAFVWLSLLVVEEDLVFASWLVGLSSRIRSVQNRGEEGDPPPMSLLYG